MKNDHKKSVKKIVPGIRSAVITDRQSAFAAIRIPHIVTILLIFLIGLLVYFNSFHNEFLFDDINIVVDNTIIRDFKNVASAFTHDLTYYSGDREGKFYRPLQTLTYMMDYSLGGLIPVGYHATNTILHIVVSILLFYVASRITANRLLSSLTALAYLVHPVHTEAVTYISGRADSMCTIFLLLMIMFQFRYWGSDRIFVKAAYYACIMASFLLALLSKEFAVVFPFLLIFTEYCLRSKEKYTGLLNRRVLFYIPMAAMIVMWLVVKNAVVPTEAMTEDPNALKLAVTIKMAPKAIFDYIKISFLPLNLHMEYLFPFPESIFQREYFGPFIFILFFLPALYVIWKKGRFDINYRILFFALGWFIIALLPYLYIFFPLNSPFAEHWLYVSEIGLLLFAGYLLLYNAEKIKWLGKLTILLYAVFIAVFSALTIKQNVVWKDGITFYSYTLKHAPYSSKMYNALALEYIHRKEFGKAKDLLEKALEIDPNNKVAAENLKYLKLEIGEMR